ncbi:hypothetical protein [Streptomyces sp. NBC_00140]|uniref:hypothetical protein n=1 Tax=Streptomyces sp. NBC_00140 TaxID=2975664 RepID=UPI00225B490C|nr:hypothetical protein [Streptomyces sp. NBC_00140]MCX5336009.1 hypothetical protein [Streptomyces sp. NBC_00140]
MRVTAFGQHGRQPFDRWLGRGVGDVPVLLLQGRGRGGLAGSLLVWGAVHAAAAFGLDSLRLGVTESGVREVDEVSSRRR